MDNYKLKHVTNKDKFREAKNQSFIEYIHENKLMEQFSWGTPIASHGSWHMSDGLLSAVREGIKIDIDYRNKFYEF